MSRINIFQPEYFKNFKCIGDKCKNDCCHNWKISIDKKTYDKYLSLDTDENENLTNKIKITCEEPFSAEIILDENKNCPFLNEGKLCIIHTKYGHDYLSSVCRVYPRRYCYMDGTVEAYLNLSCEAAARVSLFDSRVMKLEESTVEQDEVYCNGILNHEKYTHEETPAENVTGVFWKIRSTVFFIIQSRQYKLWHRLIILGLFIKQTDELLSTKRITEIPRLCFEFRKRIKMKLYDELNNQIPSKNDTNILFILNLLDINKVDNHVINICINKMKEGLGITSGELDIQTITDNYTKCNEKFYMPFFNNKEYILENYILNQIFASGFPYNYESEGSIFKNYMHLIIKYSLVKSLLIGIAGYYKEDFGEDAVIEVITSFSRLFDHSKSIIDYSLEFFNKNKITELGALTIFIKD